ncbi:hypothetical protein GCM10017784_34800 [Deinococcus indicus]|uniref:hypothetical protein n=1 Tax=Deinococcus indicus TaxID=223556 RepID=UPI00174AB3B2|nr:hypothetical protein [Deinococcus indicus]GHG37473.1 hypothetical protein GCM10017784_34800 [Deinococcus indicus]
MDYAALLEQHGGDALKALEALDKDAQKRIDDEGQAAARARRQRDEARTERDKERDELLDLRARVPQDGAVILTGDDATTWQGIQEKGGAQWLTARLTAAETADSLNRQLVTQRATQTLGVPEDVMTEWLAGRELATTTAQEDGQDVTVYGVQVDGQFKPLTEFKTFTALLGEEGDQNRDGSGRSFIDQRSGGKRPSTDGIAKAQNARGASHLRPKEN